MNTSVIYYSATSMATMANIIDLGSEKLGKAIINGNMSSDGDVSPVTLSSAWSRVARLLLLASLAVGGSVGNVFMISAVVVEDQLNKRGTPIILSLRLQRKTIANAESACKGEKNRSHYINLRRRIKIVKTTLGRIEKGAGDEGWEAVVPERECSHRQMQRQKFLLYRSISD